MEQWNEQFEMATSMLALRTIKHQRRNLRQRTCAILKKLLHHHTHSHHQWVKKRDEESLQAEYGATMWAWLGPALLVRAYGGDHAGGNEPELTLRQQRKRSLQQAEKRSALAEN